jgi:hypothetical protein
MATASATGGALYPRRKGSPPDDMASRSHSFTRASYGLVHVHGPPRGRPLVWLEVAVCWPGGDSPGRILHPVSVEDARPLSSGVTEDNRPHALCGRGHLPEPDRPALATPGPGFAGHRCHHGRRPVCVCGHYSYIGGLSRRVPRKRAALCVEPFAHGPIPRIGHCGVARRPRPWWRAPGESVYRACYNASAVRHGGRSAADRRRVEAGQEGASW